MIKIDAATYKCFELCYNYFLQADEVVKLYFLRFQMNISNEKEKNKDVRRSQEVIRTRFVYLLFFVLLLLLLLLYFILLLLLLLLFIIFY